MVFPAGYETLQDLLDKHFECYRQMATDSKESISPIIIGYTQHKKYTLHIWFNDDFKRSTVLKFVKLFFAFHEIERYTFAFEAWTIGGDRAKVEKEANRLARAGLRYPDSPMSIECLMAMAISRTKTLTKSLRINKDRTLSEFPGANGMTEIGGDFAELLELNNKAVLDPQMRGFLRQCFASSPFEIHEEKL